MKRRGAALILMMGLAACQATAPRQQATALQDDIMQLKTDRDAGRISYTEWAERTGALAHANVKRSREQSAAIAYRTELARRVDAGELSREQFERESVRTLQKTKASRQALR